MRWIACGLFLFSLCLSEAHAQPRDRASSRLERELRTAERFVARGNLQSARAAFLRIAERTPSDGRAGVRYCDLAVPETAETVEALLADAAQVQSAAEQCETLLRATPGTATSGTATPGTEARVRWVRALLGEVTAYVESFEEAGLDENDITPLRQAAALALHAGDASTAERALGYALHIRPQDSSIQHDLALVLLARGDADGSLPYFRRVVAAQPSDLRALRDYAGALLQAGQTTTAIMAYESLVARTPEASEAWLSLARARIEAGDYPTAASDAAHALELASVTDARAALLRGDALRLAGDVTGARQAYEEALRREPRNARARQAILALASR